VAHQQKDDRPADVARRATILAALLGEIRYGMPVEVACRRWDRRLRMRDAEAVFRNLKGHPVAEDHYADALQRTTAIWRTPAFQRDVTTTLKRIGFPDSVALRLAAPALELYLAWAADRPIRTPRRPGVPVRGPKGDNLPVWAHYFYLIDVCGWSTRGLVKVLHFGPRESAHAHFPGSTHPDAPNRAAAYWPRFDCGCRKAVRDALKETRRLLGVAPQRSDPAADYF